MINAREESLAEKPAFKRALRKQRCVILADGFYEWKVIPGQRRKQPMLIRLKSREVFALAGLWDRWASADETEIISSTIITTTPNELVSSVHNCMPVILRSDCVQSWLSEGDHSVEFLLSCLVPYPSEEMEMYPVSLLVNKPGVDHIARSIPRLPG